ncbi:disintegrin and metalloproteinase domain-containing protein 26A-like isoform X2 [Watersipora subatra]|uniref:disintegrin and metalloproteinase domain-containing protein 26A-like isoform X2 n=1 Tax=Watersipora subatra TaxID=2589382 RepID=UPI00355BE773
MAPAAIDFAVMVLWALATYGVPADTAIDGSELVDIAIGIPHTEHHILLKHRDQLDTLERILDHGAAKRISMVVSTPTHGEVFSLHLVASPLFMPENLKVTYFSGSEYSGTAQHRYIDSRNFSCLYTSEAVAGKTASHIELCNGQLRGDITARFNRTFHISMLESKEKVLSFVMVERNMSVGHGQCGNKDHFKRIARPLHRKVRNAVLSHSPANHNDTTRYLELYVVVDHELYLRSSRNLVSVSQRVVSIVNYASSLYRQLNIYLALVEVEVWTEGNKISVTGEAKNVLESFKAYRQNQINPNTPNDIANLFAAEKFSGSTVGQSSVSICVDLGGVAVTADQQESDWIPAATTMAHEIGHNLGIVHDDALKNAEECICPREDVDDNKCIMYSKSLAIQPIAWSQCTIDFVRDSFQKHGADYCLKNLPDSVKLQSSCGNYFVEEGEECDCGPSEECNSKCCEPLTCKFTSGSQCATGSCCDMDTCQLKPATTTCREVSNKLCDLSEYCDGVSEWCPANTFISNGIQCSTQPIVYCYEGECKSRDAQCEYVWGSGSINSIDKCYTRWNVYGNYFGNCGYSVGGSNSSLIYRPCLPDDSMCGLLQCNSSNKDAVLKLHFYYDYHGRVSLDGQAYPCSTILYDVGLNTRQPSLVPDGAACGNNSWCMEQQCVERPQLPEHCLCSGEGTCNQYYECHCNEGFDPRSDCLEPGPGGSVRSGPQNIYLPVAATTSTKNSNWVTPVLVTLLIVVLVAIVVVLVIKRQQVQSRWKRCWPRAKQRCARDKSTQSETPAAKREGKFSSLVANRGGNSRRSDFISNPILESTTNQSMKLRDIPNAPLTLDPISNPTYSSDEVKDPETTCMSSGEANTHTYSVCNFGDDPDSEEDNAYEDMPLNTECT